MEQLAERDVHETEDDRERVQRVEGRVEAPLEPHARHGEEQTRDRHREQAGEGEEVAAALDRQGARVAEPAPEEDEHAGQHQHGGDVEGVEDQPTDDAAGIEVQRADPRHEHLIAVGPLADALEVQQAERQGEGDQGGEDAAPEHELVRQPPSRRPPADEPLGQQLGGDQ